MKIGMVEIARYMANRNLLARDLKPEIPGVLRAILEEVAQAAGAPAGAVVATTFQVVNTPTGTTLTARVCTVDEFGAELEEVGTIDVNAAVMAMPDATLIAKLNL